MAGNGKRGKPKAGFPTFPTALGNRKSAISTFPQPLRLPRGKVEIQKQDFHFPIAAFCSLEEKPRKEIPLNAGFPVVQAHRSIGICCAPCHTITRLYRNYLPDHREFPTSRCRTASTQVVHE